jgi:hypothetical protein
MVTEGSSDASIGFFFSDIGAFVEILFPFAHGKLELHELLPSIQSNRHQCQALDADFSYQRADFGTPKEKLA